MSDPICCGSCKKTALEANLANLKVCAKCKSAFYCSRECQKADWKTHKKACSQNAANSASSTPSEHGTTYTTLRSSVLQKHISNPFTRLDNGTYLHDRPEQDVYKLLIDCFRMRQEDDYNMEGDVDEDSVYSGSPTSIKPFSKFLLLASSRPKLLPPWWNDTKKAECEAFSRSDNWSNLSTIVEKQDVIDHYGNQRMPMQLRMLGEAVYNRGPGGQDGTSMRKMMMKMESGQGGYMSMLSLV